MTFLFGVGREVHKKIFCRIKPQHLTETDILKKNNRNRVQIKIVLLTYLYQVWKLDRNKDHANYSKIYRSLKYKECKYLSPSSNKISMIYLTAHEWPNIFIDCDSISIFSNPKSEFSQRAFQRLHSARSEWRNHPEEKIGICFHVNSRKKTSQVFEVGLQPMTNHKNYYYYIIRSQLDLIAWPII